MRSGKTIATLCITILLTACSRGGKLPTSTPSIIPPKQISTSTPQLTVPVPTGTPQLTEFRLYQFISHRNYGYQIFDGITASEPFSIDSYDVGLDNDYDREIELNGPGDAQTLAFSHYSNQIAYWTLGEIGALWLSDLEHKNPQLLLTDTEARYPNEPSRWGDVFIWLEWTPDDQHIIVNVIDNPALNLIYHLKSDEYEPWPYVCDRVALSTRTQKLATWCRNTDLTDPQSEFGVIEWDGEVWISENPPATKIVNQDEEFYPLWAWSPDGRIAFYDLNDEKGRLSIANLEGNILLQTLPESAYWFVEKYGVLKWVVEPNSTPIVWSANGERMAIYAIGYEQNACPPFAWELAEDPIEQVPCWHVFDLDSNEIVWTVTHTLNLLDPDASKSLIGNTTPWDFYAPAISPNGKLLYIAPFADNYIISVQTAEVLWQNYFSLDAVTWGEVPGNLSPP